MTDKELRRLSRSELLEMLIAQTEENSQLKIRLKQAEAQLRDRRIEIDKAGSLAEAAPQRCLSGGGGRGAAVSGKYPADQQSAKEAAQIRQEAEAYSQKVHADADAYWKQVAARASKLLADQEALRQLIQSAGEVEINEEHSKSVPRASNPGTARNGA